MPQYDTELPEEPQQDPICSYVFINEDIISEYDSDMCRQLIHHGRKGYTVESFCGRFNINIKVFGTWLSEAHENFKPDLLTAKDIAIAAYISYWEQTLDHAQKHFSQLGGLIPVCRGILADARKSLPTALRDDMFNTVRSKTPEQMAEEERLKDINQFNNSLPGYKDEE